VTYHQETRDPQLAYIFLFCLFPFIKRFTYPEWFTSKVKNGNDREAITDNNVINSKRKSFRQRSIESVFNLMNSSKVSQRLNVSEDTTTKVVAKPDTLTLAKPVAISDIRFRTRRDLDYHIPSFCSRSLASDQGETVIVPFSICLLRSFKIAACRSGERTSPD
jgi:hypothetical protein